MWHATPNTLRSINLYSTGPRQYLHNDVFVRLDNFKKIGKNIGTFDGVRFEARGEGTRTVTHLLVGVIKNLPLCLKL